MFIGVNMKNRLMNGVVIDKYGSSDVLQFRTDLKIPDIGENQLLIEVAAASINPLDIHARNGKLAFVYKWEFPMILGNDISGRVLKIGKKVTKFQVGDSVFGMIDTNAKPARNGFAGTGAYAQFCITREDTLAKIPSGYSFMEAACVPLTALTVYQTFKSITGNKSGKHILINGASGGVGTMAIQLSKAMGMIVTAVCSGKNIDYVKSLGADYAIDYSTDDFLKSSRKYDYVYDVVAKYSFMKCKKVLESDGIYISNIANLSTIFSLTYRNRHAWVKANGSDLDVISKMIEKSKIKAVIDSTFELKELNKAHDFYETNSVQGKIVIKMHSEN